MGEMDAKRKPSKADRLDEGSLSTSTDGKISRLIAQDQLNTVFQPIVDMMTGKIFAYESLARTSNPEIKSPPQMFDMAIAEGMCGKLGRRLRELSVDGCPDTALFM